MSRRQYLLTSKRDLRMARTTLTLEEALAYVRLFVESGDGNWSDYEIRHDDGRRWTWEMQGRHGVIKVDNPPATN